MPELGTTLSEARVARGLTLEDCERDTRISKRYLDALEREDWRVFPAPVYSRAFLRTYAQYLNLDADRLIRLQASAAEPAEIKPLPEVRTAPPSGSINWPLAGAVLVLVLIAGGFVWMSSRGGDDGSPAVQSTPVAGEARGGGAGPGRTVGDVEKGVVPDRTPLPASACPAATRSRSSSRRADLDSFGFPGTGNGCCYHDPRALSHRHTRMREERRR
jgi:transcriptional regulator with XRE-family HTH domain